MSETTQAYCVKCKTKREMVNPTPVYTSTGTPATSGECSVCGTKLFRMGMTAAHEGIAKPEVVAKPKREFRRVNSVCGRAKLAHFVVDRPVRPSKMSRGFWEYYHLLFDDEDLKFVISAEQYQTLAEGIIYRAYYDPAKPDRVMSIERPDGGCEAA